jgi:hypothetical protein
MILGVMAPHSNGRLHVHRLVTTSFGCQKLDLNVLPLTSIIQITQRSKVTKR